MNLKIIFKRLVLLDLFTLLTSVFFLIFLGESEIVLNFNQTNPLGNIYLLIIFIYLIAYLVSIFLLYKLKKFGKKLYLFVFILGIIMTLTGGPTALDAWLYTLDGLNMSVAGAILVFLYLTPIKKEFDK